MNIYMVIDPNPRGEYLNTKGGPEMITVYDKSRLAAALGLHISSLEDRHDLPAHGGESPDGRNVYWLSSQREVREYLKTRSKRASMT